MITIKEIADQLGVSATTVSNVLNGRAGKMSQETRQRVEEALLRNHYVKEKKNNRGEPQHHLVAVYICLGKKKHVLTDPFCGSLLEGIDRELRKYNRAMVCGTVDDNESFAKYCRIPIWKVRSCLAVKQSFVPLWYIRSPFPLFLWIPREKDLTISD